MPWRPTPVTAGPAEDRQAQPWREQDCAIAALKTKTAPLKNLATWPGGAGDAIRTRDIFLGKEVLYH